MANSREQLEGEALPILVIQIGFVSYGSQARPVQLILKELLDGSRHEAGKLSLSNQKLFLRIL